MQCYQRFVAHADCSPVSPRHACSSRWLPDTQADTPRLLPDVTIARESRRLRPRPC